MAGKFIVRGLVRFAFVVGILLVGQIPIHHSTLGGVLAHRLGQMVSSIGVESYKMKLVALLDRQLRVLSADRNDIDGVMNNSEHLRQPADVETITAEDRAALLHLLQ